MDTKFFSIGFLLLCWWGAFGWATSPFDEETPVVEYSAFLQEQADLFSERMDRGDQEQELLAAEYRRWADRTLDEVLGGWEERMTDAVSREDTGLAMERMVPEIEKQKRMYRRQSEQLAELFIRRYLTSDTGTEPDFSSSVYGSTGRSIEEFDRMLRMQINGAEGPRSISEWQKAEESLLTERMEWEEGVEQKYSHELARMKEEYQGMLLEEERWEQQFMEEFLAEREDREEQLVLFESNTSQALEDLAARLSSENEVVVGMDQKLAGAMNTAKALIYKAKEQIFLENDYGYWSTVERENLELYEESFDTRVALRADLPGPIGGIEKGLYGNADLRLDLAQQERRHLEVMIEYLSLPPSDRPGRDSLEFQLVERRDAFLEARQEYGPCSGQAGEAYDGFVRTGMMLDLADQDGRALLPGLKEDLREVKSKEELYAAERLNLRQDLPRVLEAVRNDREVVDLRESLSEVKILGEIDTSLVQAAELVDSKGDLLHQKREQLKGEIDREIKSLLSSGDLDTDILYPLVEELKERVCRKDLKLLQDFAFALYHEKGSALDPGYISSNQVYQKLKGKLDFSEDDSLDTIAAEAFAEVRKSDDLKELFGIYKVILAGTEPGTSAIHRGMIEDLGEVLFDSVIKAADNKISSLDKKRNTVLSHAAYNSGLAAISYSYLNAVAGAAFTALAAGFYKEAADVKKEMDDIDSLRDSLAEQGMSGRDERYALGTGANYVVSIHDRRQEVLREYELFTSREHTAEQWIEKLSEGFGDLNGILACSVPGLDGEAVRERVGQLTKGESGSFTLVEFLDLARRENETLLGRREAENRTLLEEAEQTVIGLRGTVLPGIPRENLETLLKAATLVEVAGTEVGTGSTEQLVRSRNLRIGVELSSLKTRAGYIYDQMETRYVQWLGQRDYLRQTGRTVWKNRKEDLRSSVSEWDLSFREEYHKAESMWDRRSLQMEEFRREGLRQLSEEGAQRVVKEGMTRLQLTPANYAARSTLVDFTSLPRWSAPVHTQTPVLSSRESLDLFSALDGESPSEELLPEMTCFQERYGKYFSSIDALYGRAEEMVQEVTYETGLSEMSRIVRRHQEDLLSSIDRANARIEGNLHTTLQAAGYRKKGNEFRRNALVDLTFFKHEKESQSIRAYREYTMDNPGWDRQLEALISRGNSASVNQSRYSELLEKIEKQRQIVFGEYEGDGSDPVGYVSSVTENLFLHAREEFQNSVGYADHDDMKGLLAWHIGYVPEMDEDDPQRVRRGGFGEVGRIMTDYFIHEARLGRGLGMMDTAAWDRRLWDDDKNNDGESDGLVKAATVRSLSDLGMQVASALFLPPGAGSLVAGLTDDLFFAVADTMGGYADAGNAFFNFGEKAILQVAMAGNSSLWGGTSQIPTGWSDGVGLFDGVMPAIGTTTGNTLLSSSAAALDMKDGKIHWSNEKFGDSLLDKESQFSLVSSLTGNISSNLMENKLFDRESLYGFSCEDIGTMRGSVQYGGELLNAAAEYAYTGSTSFNLAGIGGTGLLELNIDGKDLQWAAGSGGTRVSLENINTLIGGFDEFSLRREINRYGDSHFATAEEGELAEQVLRFLHSFGDDQAGLTLEALLTDERGMGFVDQSYYRGVTLADGEAGDITSYLSTQGASTQGANSMLPASYAVTLQHEGYRDGLVRSGNAGETLNAVLGHIGMAGRIVRDDLYGGEALYGDTRVFRDMAFMGSGAPAEALLGAYSSSGDYWKIDAHGDVLWDGSHHLWGEGGHLVASHERGSFSRDLADYLGIEQGEALKMMEDVGLIYDPGVGTYVQTGDAAPISATPALEALYDMERRFNPQQDGVLPVDRDLAYAWALKEHEYRLLSGDYPGDGYLETVEAILESPDDFAGVTGLYEGAEFTGIKETATLYHYSQQRLEERVTGSSLDAAKNEGYCLAESIAFNYVDQVEGVNWEDLEDAFQTTEWGGSFDPYSGYVGDKGAFTRGLSETLGLEMEAREYRFSSMDDLNTYLYESSPASGEYHMVADYGSHFTYVRPDGLEVNTYPGWTPPAEGPEEWRVYIWDSE